MLRLSDVKSWLDVKSVRGDEVLALCPFHGDSKPSFYLNLRKAVYYCWGCEAKGYVGEKAKPDPQKVSHKAFDELIGRLYVNEYVEPFDLPGDYTCMKRFDIDNSMFWKYAVVTRKIKPHILRRFRLGYCYGGDYEGCVIVPLEVGFAARSALSEVMTRVIRGRDERYLYPLGLPIKKLMFNFQKHAKILILVEGVFDALRLISYGFEATAMFGAKISYEQVKRLCEADAVEVVLAYDGDEAGERASLKAYNLLSPYFKVRHIQFPEGRDPGNCSKKIWTKLFLGRNVYKCEAYRKIIEGI